MKRQPLTFFALLALPLAACGSSDSGTSSASSAATSEVVVQNYTFPAITTAPGATLRLVDRDDEPHTVTADNGEFKAGPFNSKAPGTLVVPSKPGTYAFHCEIHSTMHGTLVVQNP